MSVYSRNSERRRVLPEYCNEDKEYSQCYGSQEDGHGHLESEKKVRREIANSNERRRMQSINAGFQSLKTLIPHSDGEKLSKAAILQHTADFIQNLKREKDRLESENSQLQKMLTGSAYGSPPRKRWKRDTESSDEGITADYDELSIDDVRREMVAMKCQLERERRLRIELEKHSYPSNIRELANQVQIVQMQTDNVVYVDSTDDVKEEIEMKTDEDKPVLIGKDHDSQESVSSRNIATIVEAIRHLEGDRLGFEEHRHGHSIPHSEEDEKESSVTSDQEDMVNSDSDSPMSYRPQQHIDIKYHTEVLHSPHLEHYVYRPGVIVQKS
ncbi:TFAP4 [Mytilus edulis]|uniref:TFAP4 n=1 Tax=Mytilus edulis TaxID=6550 RepID=A0A8S3RMP6_MYTED|nr:TFAP4 [Mytilus edulis]